MCGNSDGVTIGTGLNSTKKGSFRKAKAMVINMKDQQQIPPDKGDTAEGKLRLCYPVIVEGKYDKIKLSSLFEGQIFCTEGFGIFKNREEQAFFQRLAKRSPVILLTDSDHAGMMIRNRFKTMIPKERLIHVYIPQVKGKERRKATASAEGFLGVEGSEAAMLTKLLAPYTEKGEPQKKCGAGLRRIDLFEKGYDGAPGAAEKRKALCKRCGLPDNLSTAALVDVLNLLYTEKELEELL